MHVRAHGEVMRSFSCAGSLPIATRGELARAEREGNAEVVVAYAA